MRTLASRYLGLDLEHPIVASASPLTASFDGMRRLEDAQAAAVVAATLYEADAQAADEAYATYTEASSGWNPEATSFFPELPDYRHGLSGHVEMVRRAAASLDIPVIASLCGATDDGWIDLAKQLEQAGAAALELQLPHVSNDFTLTGPEVERRYLEIVGRVKSTAAIPVSVKLPPYFTALGNFVRQLESEGVDGATLFSRKTPLKLDLRTLHVRSEPLLSSHSEMQLPLTWIGLLSRHVNLSLAAAISVDSAVDVVKFLLVGADVVMTASSLLRHGPGHIGALILGLDAWLCENGFASVEEIRGRLDASHADHLGAFLRERDESPVSDPALS